MKAALLLCALVTLAACDEPQQTPDAAMDAGTEEQKLDPLKVGRQLIDEREKDGQLDRAVSILEWHSAQKPQDPKIHLLAAEAYSRSLEAIGEHKAEQKSRVQRLLLKGKPHGEAAMKLEPANGAALYWAACLLLHEADFQKSLGRANEAFALLEKAETADPKIDDGGPARMKGRVLYEMPALVGGSVPKAIASFKKSLAVAPDCMTTHLWLGEAYEYAKHPDLARKELEWVVAAKVRPGHEKEDGVDKGKAEELLKKLKP